MPKPPPLVVHWFLDISEELLIAENFLIVDHLNPAIPQHWILLKNNFSQSLLLDCPDSIFICAVQFTEKKFTLA